MNKDKDVKAYFLNALLDGKQIHFLCIKGDDFCLWGQDGYFSPTLPYETYDRYKEQNTGGWGAGPPPKGVLRPIKMDKRTQMARLF